MVTTRDYIQSLLHHGRVIEAGYFHNTGNELADLAVTNILVVTGEREVHAYADIKHNGAAEVYGYGGVQVSANGTEIPFRNRHYNPPKEYAPLVKAYVGPTITDTGISIYDDLVLGGVAPGGGPGGSRAGGATNFGDGFILAPNQKYILRTINVSGAAALAHIKITAHEQINTPPA